MNIQEFSNALAQAARNLPKDQQKQLVRLFQEASRDLSRPSSEAAPAGSATKGGVELDENGVPLGMTDRLRNLKEN